MKKIFALIALALLLCCCGNNSSQKPEEPTKSNSELYPEKYTGAYISQRAISLLDEVQGPKDVISVGVINESVADVKLYYLDAEHHMVLKFVEGDWEMVELDGVKVSPVLEAK